MQSEFVPVRGRSFWPDSKRIDSYGLTSVKAHMSDDFWDNINNKRNAINFFMPMRGRKFDDKSHNKDALYVFEGNIGNDEKRSTFTAMRGKKTNNRYEFSLLYQLKTQCRVQDIIERAENKWSSQ